MDTEQERPPGQEPQAAPEQGSHLSFPLELPSAGLPYNGSMPGGNVEISPLTTREEMIIAGFREQGMSDPNLLIDSILKNCLKLPTGVAYEDLLITDRFFLIANVRAISFGEDYGFTWRCGCRNKEQRSVHQLPGGLKLFKLAPDFHEPFEVKLPKCGKTIGMRLLRISDEKAIERYRDQMIERATEPIVGDPGYLFRMARRIVTVDGEEWEIQKKLDLLGNPPMLSVDSIAMRKKYEDNECGLDLSVTTKCRFCGQEREANLPFSAEFFRPEESERGGETALS